MFFLLEIDKKWAGFGIEWYPHVKGFRAGWVALHWFHSPFENFMELANMKYHNTKLTELNAETARQTQELRNQREMLCAEVATDVLQ